MDDKYKDFWSAVFEVIKVLFCLTIALPVVWVAITLVSVFWLCTCWLWGPIKRLTGFDFEKHIDSLFD